MLGSCLGPTGLKGERESDHLRKWQVATGRAPPDHLADWQTGRVVMGYSLVYAANFIIGKSSPRGCLGLMRKNILIYYSMR